MGGIVHGPGEGEEIRLGSRAPIVFKADAETTNGGFNLSDYTLDAGAHGPPPHYHEQMIDAFFVLEGTLTLQLDDETVAAGPGSFVLIEPGTVHTFRNDSAAACRFLNINSPAGFEQYFREAAAATKPGEPPDLAALAEIAKRYDFHPV